MKLLLITPFYDTDGRPDLKYDTSAVHYFVKYWTGEHEVKVFHVYPHSYKDILRYRSPENRRFYKEGYVFTKDGAEICITEVQKLPGQKGNYFRLQRQHILHQFRQWLDGSGFVPDMIIAHVPSYAYTFLREIADCFGGSVPAFGILHKTDIEELAGNSALKTALERGFTALYARSHGIRRKAEACALKNLKQDILYSGIPGDIPGGGFSPCTVDGTLRIVYAGKLVPLKHVDTVLRAISAISGVDIRFHIIGAGPEEARLRALTRELGLEEKVSFLGTMSRAEVVAQMRKANLYCMPSFPETLGLTYLEAMSVGCVPIGTRGEGIDGIIRDGWNGYLADTEELLESVTEKLRAYLALDDTQRQALSAHAVETVKDMDEKTCADRYLRILQKELTE